MRLGLSTATLVATCTSRESELQQVSGFHLEGFSLVESQVNADDEFKLNYDMSFGHTEVPASAASATLFVIPEPLGLLFVGLGLIVVGLLLKPLR